MAGVGAATVASGVVGQLVADHQGRIDMVGVRLDVAEGAVVAMALDAVADQGAA